MWNPPTPTNLMRSIPFYKPSITEAEIQEVVDTLRSGWLTTGAKTKEFERQFGEYIQQPHAIAVNSCTAALHLALEAVGVLPGDGVVVPTMTFAATAEVVRYLGADPVLADCHPADFNLDVSDAEIRIKERLAAGKRVTAIMPVHFGGQVADVKGYKQLAANYGLKIIEDAAHCCPAFYDLTESAPGGGNGSTEATTWAPVGKSADISCFSFYANKCITTGEGGMVCTENAEYADRMRIMSLHGISRDAWKRFSAEGSWYYEIIAPGYKYNLTDVASAIGIHQLRRSNELHAKRCRLAEVYRQSLQSVDEIVLPSVNPGRIHSWHLYPIRLRLEKLQIDRGQFIQELKAAGIITSVHYMPLHMHPYYRDRYGYEPGDLPRMASEYQRILTLPLYPDLSAEDQEYVCTTVKSIVARSRRS